MGKPTFGAHKWTEEDEAVLMDIYAKTEGQRERLYGGYRADEYWGIVAGQIQAIRGVEVTGHACGRRVADIQKAREREAEVRAAELAKMAEAEQPATDLFEKVAELAEHHERDLAESTHDAIVEIRKDILAMRELVERLAAQWDVMP